MSKAEQDLAYVQEVVRDSESGSCAPRSIFILWAIIYLVGFSLYDVSNQVAGVFWMIAGPGGGVLSYWLGRRNAMRLGEASRRQANRHLLHWVGMATAIFMAVPLLSLGVLNSDALAKIILLIMAFGMYSAGIYLVRPYMWVGIALGACYLAVMTISGLPWTVVGGLSGGAMLLAAFLGDPD